MPSNYGGYWDRQFIPDVMPRKFDVDAPPSIGAPIGAPFAGGPVLPNLDLFSQWVTTPGVRPIVYLRATNYSLSVTDQPQPIANAGFQCDAMIIDVPSSGTNSVFVTFGQVGTGQGLEVQKGIPLTVTPDNSREQWELQRMLETIAAMIAGYIQLSTGQTVTPPGTFMAPRVIINAHDYWISCAATLTQTVNIMLFLVPEFQ